MTVLVVVSEFMDEAALEAFGQEVEVLYDPGLVDAPDRLATALAEADALIVRNRTQVRGPLLEAAPRLRVVGRLGVGLDNIDMEACAARGIAVFPAVGANALSVAEYVIGTAAALVRGAYSSNAAMIAGDWPRARLGTGGELSGRVMGLYGLGSIARVVAGIAHALGMSVIACDPHLPEGDPAWQGVRRCDAATLLAEADVLSLHLPLTAQTRGLLDEAALGAMKPGAVLVNTARGGIVDEGALVAALHSGHLGGAALDVFETEPLTAEAGALFRDVPNLILTPHIAGVTAEANLRVSAVTVENVRRALAQTGPGDGAGTDRGPGA